MFLHDEGVASSRNIVQMQTAKMQKYKTLLHSIDLQHDITFLPLQNLCISLQKGQKRVFLRGGFCIEMLLRTHKTHRNQVGFCVFGVCLYVILNEIHAEGSGCQQPTANGFRLLVEVFRSLREALESIFSK
jgi:hypothetical protein